MVHPTLLNHKIPLRWDFFYLFFQKHRLFKISV
nr:MAG TPA: hypothetical protein [Caudoviricetes sp.]